MLMFLVMFCFIFFAGCQRDIVILDVDSKDVSLGMSCPPAAFVEAEFLKSVDQILKPTGISS